MGGTEGFTSVTGEGNDKQLNYVKEGNKTSFNMNKHNNYDKDNLPQEIKDFMAL
jgi:hypothetical protein